MSSGRLRAWVLPDNLSCRLGYLQRVRIRGLCGSWSVRVVDAIKCLYEPPVAFYGMFQAYSNITGPLP